MVVFLPQGKSQVDIEKRIQARQVSLPGSILNPTYNINPFPHDVLQKTAAHANAAAVKAAHISDAAATAHNAAFEEASLASKASLSVEAAEYTYNIANNLVSNLGAALSEAEAVLAQAWKALKLTKSVEISQRSMVVQAQHVANTLGNQKYISLSELRQAQKVAAQAHHVANEKLASLKNIPYDSSLI
ncbi:UNVERIFIED_CONTAM: hypothetical protein RMT77_002417 [Armadillidium vulgare]